MLLPALSLVTADESDGGFVGPSIGEFVPPGLLFVGTPFELNRVMLIRLLVVFALVIFLWLGTRRHAAGPLARTGRTRVHARLRPQHDRVRHARREGRQALPARPDDVLLPDHRHEPHRNHPGSADRQHRRHRPAADPRRRGICHVRVCRIPQARPGLPEELARHPRRPVAAAHPADPARVPLDLHPAPDHAGPPTSDEHGRRAHAARALLHRDALLLLHRARQRPAHRPARHRHLRVRHRLHRCWSCSSPCSRHTSSRSSPPSTSRCRSPTDTDPSPAARPINPFERKSL